MQQEHSGDSKQVEKLMCIQPVNMASVIFVSISILVNSLIHPPTNGIFEKELSPINQSETALEATHFLYSILRGFNPFWRAGMDAKCPSRPTRTIEQARS